MIRRVFRSRLPAPLSTTEVTRLSSLSTWSESDVRDWYERFTHCDPSGHLTLEEFGAHLQYITIFQNRSVFQLDRYVVKQIFNRFDKDDDKKLNFEEVLQCHLFMHLESNRQKLKFILKLYNPAKTKYYAREKVFDILMNLFDLFNIEGERDGREKKIHFIINQLEPRHNGHQISWTNICRSINKDSSLIKYLLRNDEDAMETNTMSDHIF